MKKYVLLAFVITVLVWFFIDVLPRMGKSEKGNPANTKYGVIRSGGEMVIPFEYDYLTNMNDTLLVAKKDGKYGIINLNNEVFFPFIYEKMYVLNGEKAIVYKDNEAGIMDPSREIMILPKYEDICLLAPEDTLLFAQKDGLYGIVNYMTGENITPFMYKKTTDAIRNVIVLEDKGKAGAINWQGEVILPFEYTGLELRSWNNCIVVCKKDLYGVTDLTGDILIPVEYEEIRVGEDGMFLLKKNGLWGLSDINHDMKTPFIYEYMGNFCSGVVAVTTGDSKYGVIDRSGDTVVPFDYTFIGTFIQDYADARVDHLYSGVINKSGDVILPFGDYSYDVVWHAENLVVARYDRRCALMNMKGDLYTEFAYDYILPNAYDGYLDVENGGKHGALDTLGNEIVPCISDGYLQKFGGEFFIVSSVTLP